MYAKKWKLRKIKKDENLCEKHLKHSRCVKICFGTCETFEKVEVVFFSTRAWIANLKAEHLTTLFTSSSAKSPKKSYKQWNSRKKLVQSLCCEKDFHLNKHNSDPFAGHVIISEVFIFYEMRWEAFVGQLSASQMEFVTALSENEKECHRFEQPGLKYL